MSETAERKHIVVLDDDAKLRLLIGEYLEAHDLRVSAVASGAELTRLLEREPADVVILDVMMPVEDGISVLKRLALKPDAPGILMLSAMASDVDRILGLELGADDYIAKPVNPRELLARVRAVLRRRGPDRSEQAAEDLIRFEGWLADPSSYSLHAPDGSPVDLTTNEFRLLLALMPSFTIGQSMSVFPVFEPSWASMEVATSSERCVARAICLCGAHESEPEPLAGMAHFPPDRASRHCRAAVADRGQFHRDIRWAAATARARTGKRPCRCAEGARSSGSAGRPDGPGNGGHGVCATARGKAPDRL